MSDNSLANNSTHVFRKFRKLKYKTFFEATSNMNASRSAMRASKKKSAGKRGEDSKELDASSHKLHASCCCVIIERQRCNYRLKARLNFDSPREILTKRESLRAVLLLFLRFAFLFEPSKPRAFLVFAFAFQLKRRGINTMIVARQSEAFALLRQKLFFILLQNSIS